MTIKYIYPPYYNKHINWETITEDEAIEYQRQYDECSAKNKEIYDGAIEKLKQAREIVKDIFGEKSNEYKYIKKKRIPSPWPYSSDRPIERWKQVVEAKRRADATANAERERKQLFSEKTQRAIIWLQAKGYTLGTDFTIDNAYMFANETAFNEKIEQLKGTFIDFSGSDNCEPGCRGYDGLSNGCDCGNRRVSYSMPDYADFEDMFIEAEAY